MFHLLQVFRHDAGKALKYYITNTLKKPNRVSIRQFFVRVEQLNSYLETLPCLYYSPRANQATKKVLPLDDADLATHLLRMCPAKWQTQYDLTEKTTPVNTRALLLILEKIENNNGVAVYPETGEVLDFISFKQRESYVSTRFASGGREVILDAFSNGELSPSAMLSEEPLAVTN